MKILFISGHEFLYHPQNGGQKCSLRNYNLLIDIFGRENVYLCMFSNENYGCLHNNEKVFPTHEGKTGLLKDTLCCRNVCGRRTWKKAVSYINSLPVDAIFCDSSTIGKMLKFIGNNKIRFVFFHNIERNYAMNKVRHDSPAYIVAWFSYCLNERMAVRHSDYRIFLNRRDEAEALKLYGVNADFLLPITFEDKYSPQTEAKQYVENQKKILLFVGSLFMPNLMGIKWFVKNVMPKLENYQLCIVGKDMELKRDELSGKNIDVVGTAEVLEDYYYRADAVVIPIFYGDGMKVKTAEAMMYGKTIFATSEALEGYDIGNAAERGIYECNDEADFIRKIKKYVNGHSHINESVRTCFLNGYETNLMKQQFGKFMKQAVGQEKNGGKSDGNYDMP